MKLALSHLHTPTSEKLAKHVRVEGGAHEHELQPGPLGQQPLENDEQEVGVQVSLVHLSWHVMCKMQNRSIRVGMKMWRRDVTR